MGLRTAVLAAEINNLSDARYFAAYPVDWMSFVCNPEAKNYLPAEKITEIANWISGPKVALDVRGCQAENVEQLLEELTAEVLITDSSLEISSEIAEHYEIFRVVYVPTNGDFSTVIEELGQSQKTDAVVLDFQMNGASNEAIFSEDFNYIARTNDVLLQADIDIKQVSELVNSDLKGLVVLGGEEEKVGIRSFEDIQDLMEELEEWD